MHYLKADQVVTGAHLKHCQPNFSLSSLPPAPTILLGVVKDTAFANKCCFPDNKGVNTAFMEAGPAVQQTLVFPEASARKLEDEL